MHPSLDIVILAESPFDSNLPLSGMAAANTLLPPNTKTDCQLEIYYRESAVDLTALQSIRGRATAQILKRKQSANAITLVAAHLESPQRVRREENRKEDVRLLSLNILDIEQMQQNRRTLLVGDLNYDPYDLPLYGANYLHAVPTKTLANQKQRTVDGVERPYFYNPMWGHFGDKDGSPAGTYYKRAADLDCRFWHIPDQLLLRPDLLKYWQDDYLAVLTRIGGQDLIKGDGTPDAASVSDHLPLLFCLNL